MAGYVSHMRGTSKRFLPLLSVCLVVGFLLLAPTRAHASEPCGLPALSAGGYFFSPYESISRTPDGYLAQHFKVLSADARSFTLFWSFVDDECNSADVNTYSQRISLPFGATDWSIRFTSQTHFDVWDDQNNTILFSKDIDTYPRYTRVTFIGSIDGGISTLISQSLTLEENAAPPTVVGGVQKPVPCAGTTGGGYFFDGTYEHAEYVDGLLRIHLRLATPYNDGRTFSSRVVTKDVDCVTDTTPPGPLTRSTLFTPHTRYYSFRMVSPTHFELWNDETNTKFECADCEGDIPEGTAFVGWHGSIDAGASYIITTLFPPTEVVGCQTHCVSNILFLPGIQSSRLYTQTNGVENQLWEPGMFSLQGDAKKLELHPDGESVNQIYTKEDGAIDFVDLPIRSDIEVYRTFLVQLDGLETDGAINDHVVFPYDWRMSARDVVENGTHYADGIRFVDDEIEHLAQSSKTGKVTIVAHSNGGLVAKALMQKLEREGAANMVDKIIFVGTPHLGTPKTIASMLHGDFQNLPGWAGFVVSKETARNLSKNMEAAYGLLPSNDYFVKVATPVVTLTDAPALMSASGVTDSTIDDAAPFETFMTGAGRQQPLSSDVEKPFVLSAPLFAEATALHESLDTWVPPPGVEVFQIVGWGIDTPSGITYKEKKEFVCPTFSGCFEVTNLTHTVNMTEDGDGTVVSASAAVNHAWPTYYVDIYRHNKDKTLYNNHVSFTEIAAFQELLKQIVVSDIAGSLPIYVQQATPPSAGGRKLLLRVLSPVSLDAYDNNGNHTGLVPNPNPFSDLKLKEEAIPNSYYEEFGEGKYLGLPADGVYQINLKGLDLGTFTLQVDISGGGEPAQTVVYKDLPVTASSTGNLYIDGRELLDTVLSLDVNGDGVQENLSAAATSTNPITYIGFMKESVQTMSLGAKTKRQLLAKLSNTEHLLKKSERWDDEDDDGKESNLKKGERINTRILKKIHKIELYIQKQLAKSDKKTKKDESINQQQVAELLNMLSSLKSLVQ